MKNVSMLWLKVLDIVAMNEEIKTTSCFRVQIGMIRADIRSLADLKLSHSRRDRLECEAC